MKQKYVTKYNVMCKKFINYGKNYWDMVIFKNIYENSLLLFISQNMKRYKEDFRLRTDGIHVGITVIFAANR